MVLSVRLVAVFEDAHINGKAAVMGCLGAWSCIADGSDNKGPVEARTPTLKAHIPTPSRPTWQWSYEQIEKGMDA